MDIGCGGIKPGKVVAKTGKTVAKLRDREAGGGWSALRRLLACFWPLDSDSDMKGKCCSYNRGGCCLKG